MTLILLLLLLLAAWVGPTWRPRPLAVPRRDRPLALGHRGVRGLQPENTLAAFQAALGAGLDGIETDVQRTRDGTLVLWHDFEAGGRPVVDASLDELRRETPQLATLSELLELAAGYPDALLNLELKTLGWSDGGLPRALAEAVRASGLSDRVLVSSFSPVALLRLRRWAPELRTAYLWVGRREVPWWLRGPWPGTLLHVDALHPRFDAVTPAAVERWRRRGLMVNTWTVNDPDEVARVVAAGVDGVMADDPRALLRALGRGGGRPGPSGGSVSDPMEAP